LIPWKKNQNNCTKYGAVCAAVAPAVVSRHLAERKRLRRNPAVEQQKLLAYEAAFLN
jgi:hypothetical protein